MQPSGLNLRPSRTLGCQLVLRAYLLALDGKPETIHIEASPRQWQGTTFAGFPLRVAGARARFLWFYHVAGPDPFTSCCPATKIIFMPNEAVHSLFRGLFDSPVVAIEKSHRPSEPPSEKSEFLRNDPQARVTFLNKIAASVLNKMFECRMIP
jgi:hypothetical protein